MKVLFEISLKIDSSQKNIFFGIADEKLEIDEMYKLRYRVYLKHGYIDENETGKEIDEYDDGRSVYFIAKVEEKIIGTARLIKDNFLPTEKDCFRFEEPMSIKKIPRSKRGEIGRLIVDRYKENLFLPRHIVMLGLISAFVRYALNSNLEGGYSFIKNSLKVKLEKIKFPFHLIQPFEKVYRRGVLEKYFNDEKDLVWPIYYNVDEVRLYLDAVFGKKILFKKISGSSYALRSFFLYRFLLKINGN